jgi:DNA-binding winged helix-turn-helix (wHTH) protein
MPVPSRSKSYRFDHALLQPAQRRLLVDDKLVTVTPRAFDLLVFLVERAGDLVAKEDILDRVWAGLVVEENNLQVQVSNLRPPPATLRARRASSARPSDRWTK